MTENNMINVLIKDGVRTVNWDYFPNKGIMAIIHENDFKPIAGTIRVGSELVGIGPCLPDTPLSKCPQEVSPDGKQMRVVITMKPVLEKKPEQKKEVRADVR